MSVLEEPGASSKAKPALGGPLPLHLVALLFMAGKHVRALMGLQLEATGVLAGQDDLLLALSCNEGLTVGALAEHLGVRPSTISKMADGLAANGWIVRHKVVNDRRLSHLWLTELGAEVQAAVRRIRAELDDDLLKSLAEGERQAAQQAVSKLADLLSHRLKRLR